jgi:hypothetical protein
VNSAGRVVSGNGWLAATTDGPAYPLISARAAFELLKAQPRPLPAIGCPVNADCPGVVAQVVTGAQLGLSLQYRDTGRPVLVPSWLFTVKGSDQPVAQVAVDPRFLGGPTPVATRSPGDKPTAVDPGPPTTEVPHPRISSYSVSDAGRTLTVEYGVGVCPEATYNADAKETDKTVTVIVSAHDVKPMAPDTTCIELAKIEHSTVHLQQPLGNRTVRDEDGTEVRLDE